MREEGKREQEANKQQEKVEKFGQKSE